MKKLKFCLIGAGSIGRRHLRLLLERDDIEMCVVEPFDSSWEQVEKVHNGLKRYMSFEEALANGKPDVAIISTPHDKHTELAIQAIKAGLHVFCEKPMSNSLVDCVEMLKCANKSDKVFSVGFMFHFDPFVVKVKEIIESGKIGNIVHYSSRFGTYNTLLCSVTRHQSHTPYSVIMDCIHDTDLLCYLTKKVPDYAYSNTISSGEMELTSTPNVIDTVYRWEDGSLSAHTHFNYIEHPQVHTLEIVGDKGYIRGDFMKPSIIVGTIDGNVECIELQRDFDDVYRAEWDWFIRSIHGEREVENPADTAIYSTLLMQVQLESGMAKSEVDIHKIAKKYGFEY